MNFLFRLVPTTQPLDTVDWAFAGISSSSETRDEDGKAVRHCAWRHVVDSRTRTDPESTVIDEADMFPVEEGDLDRTLEKGRMVNPDTGLATNYEEMWRDVEPEAAASGTARPRCVVLELRDDSAERRGQVVCLGRYCQGVVRCGPDFALERWAWEPQGGWERRVRVGPLHLPCEEALGDEALAVGGSVQKDGLVWTVVEACEA